MIGQYKLCEPTISNPGSDYLFSLEFALTFTQIVKVGGVIEGVKTSQGVSVRFTCAYPTQASLSSESFTVKSNAIHGRHRAKGDLSAGFVMNLSSGPESMLTLGSRLDVTLTWKITRLPGVKFNFKNCAVVQDMREVFVIKDKCYSTTLQVAKGIDSGVVQSFSYQTFKLQHTTASRQVIACTVEICITRCELPANDDACPKDELTPYMFTVDGFKKLP